MQQKLPHKGKQVEIKWSDQAIASTVSFPPSFVGVRSFIIILFTKVAQLTRIWFVLQRGTSNPTCCSQSQRKDVFGLVIKLFDNRRACSHPSQNSSVFECEP